MTKTLADLIAKFDDVEHTDDGVLIHCPAHDDSRQSLRLTVSDKGKVLVRCRAGCPTPKVVEALGLTMRDLATMKPGEVDFTPATSTDTPAGVEETARLAVQLDRWAAVYGTLPSAEAYMYAEKRFGIGIEDGRRLGLGYVLNAVYEGDGEDRRIVNDGLPGGPRLVVPFRDKDGVPRGYQARSLLDDAQVRWLGPKSPDGASWAKVGYFEGGSGWDEVLVTEGPGDALTGVALGYDTVGIRGAGMAANESVVDTVAEMVGYRTAVIAGDGDSAGRTFAANLAKGLVAREVRVKVLAVPDDLDLTSWRERDGARFPSNVIRAMGNAKQETSSEAVLRGRDEDRYPLTDLGNARFAASFIEAQSSGVKYSPEAGYFLLKSGVWRPDKLDRARAFVQEAADRIAQIADGLFNEAMADPENGYKAKTAKRWAAWARHSQSSRGIDAALKELAALPSVSTDVNDFDKHPDLMAVANGVVNLRTGELLPHDSALLLTRRVEVDYDPAARAPRWEAFLDEVFPTYPNMPDFMRRLVGYGITGRTDEQSFAIFWGKGANGKSVFTDTLTEVFRELTVTTPFSTFEEKPSGGIPNDLAALKGARLVMASEGDQGRRMAEAVMKRVTGNDLIAARYLRKEFFEFRPTFLLMLATNFKPEFRGQDEGLWRRVKLIPWDRFFRPEERNPRLSQELLAERAGILAWAVRGSIEWFRSGLQEPDVVKGATAEYRETSDALAGFLPGVFVKDSNAGRVEGKILFDSYLEWAAEENLPAREVWTRQTFFRALEERGHSKRRSKSGMAFEGIRRMRQNERGEDPEEVRAASGLQADYPPVTPDAPSKGASLDDVL